MTILFGIKATPGEGADFEGELEFISLDFVAESDS
jgi:hypothetical protein